MLPVAATWTFSLGDSGKRTQKVPRAGVVNAASSGTISMRLGSQGTDRSGARLQSQEVVA